LAVVGLIDGEVLNLFVGLFCCIFHRPEHNKFAELVRH